MRSTTQWAAALLVFGLAITGFAQDAEISDLCAVASVEGARAGESGTPAALVVACADSQPSVSTTIGIGNGTHTVGDVGGEALTAVSTDLGNVAYTTGQVGDRAVNTSTVEVGESTVTVGTWRPRRWETVSRQTRSTSSTSRLRAEPRRFLCGTIAFSG